VGSESAYIRGQGSVREQRSSWQWILDSFRAGAKCDPET